MKSTINGTTLPVLHIGLEPGEKIISEPGQFSWMTSNVRLQTSARSAGARGILGVLGRALAGGGLFMNEYDVADGHGEVSFAAQIPGSIMEVQVQPGRQYLVHRHGFLCGTQGIELGIGFQRSLGAGIFGGEGLVLQQLAGSGTAWIELGGEVVCYDLAPGQSLNIHPGHIGLFESSVNFDITLMRGLKNALFGGDGLFIAKLTGPGKIWLQTMTVPNLAYALMPYLGGQSSASAVGANIGGGDKGGIGSVVGAVAGSVLGGMLGNQD